MRHVCPICSRSHGSLEPVCDVCREDMDEKPIPVPLTVYFSLMVGVVFTVAGIVLFVRGCG